MKTKLRRLLSILSAMVLMVCCAVPAFAFSNSDLPVGNYNSNDDFSYKEIISQLITKYPDYFKNYVFMIPQSDSSFSQYGFYWFNCDESKNFEIVKNGSQYSLKNTDNKPFKSYRCFWNYRNNEFSNVYLNGESSSDCDYPLSWQIYTFGSNCNVKIGDDDVIKDPNAPPVPFTVDYSPALSEGMSRKGTLVAPGASNDGQEIESNGLNVRVTLTDEFLKLRDSYDELKDYTYEFVCYITTSPPEKSSYEESVKNAVYTSLDYGKYMYTTSGVVDDVTDDNKEPTEWIKAEGINAGYIIGKGGSVKNVTINLEKLDSSQFTADTKLYIVVYGRLTSLSVPTPDYFDLDNQGYLCNQGSLNTKQIVTVNADPETGEGTDVVMPDYYCVTSTAFNYKDYPEYKPKIFKNGAEMDTNKPFTDYLDKKLTPDYMYDYDMDKNGESGLAPDDFEKYEEQKKLDANFGSFDFGLDSIKSVFDGTSDFFKFLTASISILPTTFLTILISFFVIMLVIVVAKWIIP